MKLQTDMTNQQQTILKEYPRPISELYLMVLNSSGKQEKNKNLCLLFELILKYISVVSLKEFQLGGHKSYKVNMTVKKLDEQLGLGAWANLIKQCHEINLLDKNTIIPLDYHVRKSEDYYPFITRFCKIIDRWNYEPESKSFALSDFIDRAVVYRNMNAHPGIHESLLGNIVNDYQRAMEQFLDLMKWMKEYPLVFNETSSPTSDQQMELRLIKLMGPNVIKLQPLNVPLNSRIPYSTLLILDRNGKPYLTLDPVIVLQKNQDSQPYSFYFMNTHKGYSNITEYVCYWTLKKDPQKYVSLIQFIDLQIVERDDEKEERKNNLYRSIAKTIISTLGDDSSARKLLNVFKDKIGIERIDAEQIENEINLKLTTKNSILYDKHMDDLEACHRSQDALSMIDIAKKVLDLFPNESAAYGYLGDAYRILEQRKEALQNYEKAIELGQESPYLFFNYAVTLKEEGLIEPAKVNFRKVIKLNAGFWESYYMIGRIFYSEKKYSEAIEMLEKCLEYNPDYSDALLSLVIVYSETGNLRKAMKLSQNIRKNVDLLLGDDLEVKEKFLDLTQEIGKHIEEVVATTEKELLSNPTNVQLYHTLSGCARIMGDREKGTQYLLKAIDVNPDDREAFLKLEDIYLDDEIESGIPRSLNLIIESNLNDPRLWVVLGMIQRREGTSSEELLSYLRAKDLGMESSFLKEQISRVYLEMNNTEKALENAQKSIQLNENNVDAHVLIGEILESIGRMPDALEHYEKVILLQPDNLNIMIKMVLAYSEKGNCHRAIELARIASEKNEVYKFILDHVEKNCKQI